MTDLNPIAATTIAMTAANKTAGHRARVRVRGAAGAGARPSDPDNNTHQGPEDRPDGAPSGMPIWKANRTNPAGSALNP